jgi:5-methylcytosine-specific restriction endonuclease McrA
VPTRLPTINGPRRKPAPIDRLSPSKRGYGRTWQRVRLAVLAADPLCRDCRAAGLTVGAEHVDHADGNVHNLTRENLVPLCAPCHSRKTVAQDGGFGNAKRGRQ